MTVPHNESKGFFMVVLRMEGRGRFYHAAPGFRLAIAQNPLKFKELR